MNSILTPTQTRLLQELFTKESVRKNFYLSGGTALAEYYLHHRFSEDLDFFTEQEVDPLAIQIILKEIGVNKIDFQQSFNRNLFFLYVGNEVIKSEFTYYPFPQIEQSRKEGLVVIDSLIDIAVNKLFTIYQKPRSRDFIDLFIIMKEKGWLLAELCQKARAKFDTPLDPLQLAQHLMESETLEDFPRMLTPLEPQQWRTFWAEQANYLKNDVLE